MYNVFIERVIILNEIDEKIQWQICSRGDEFLQKLFLKILKKREIHYFVEYGEQKERDKGRDILVFDENNFYHKIIQVKHTNNFATKKFSLANFEKELSKTLIHIILDKQQNNQVHIDETKRFIYILVLNYKYDKNILNVVSEIRANPEKVAKKLYNKRDELNNKRFKNIDFESLKSELISLIKLMNIEVYDVNKLCIEIQSSPELLFCFNDIELYIRDLYDEEEVNSIIESCNKEKMRFLEELEKIEICKYSAPYKYSIQDYAKAFSAFSEFDTQLYPNLLKEYKDRTKRIYEELKFIYNRDLNHKYLIKSSQDFYYNIMSKAKDSHKIYKNIISDPDVEKGVYHMQIESNELKGWILNE